MTFAIAPSLQSAVFAALSADPTVSGLVGTAIFDMSPTGTLPDLHVVIGEEEAKDASDVTANGSVHEILVSVNSENGGFAPAKLLAEAICDALIDTNLTLTRGRLVYFLFLRARSAHGKTPDARRIELRFKARVDDI